MARPPTYPPTKLRPTVTLGVSPDRDRTEPYAYTARGKVKRPSGVTKATGCKGTVTVRIKQRKSTVGKKKVFINKTCHYDADVTTSGVSGRRGILRVIATFNGNDVLLPANSPSKFVHFGKPKHR